MALITGGARRVGRAVALHLAGAGWDIAVTYCRSRSEADELAGEISALGRRCHAFQLDLAWPDVGERARDEITRHLGRLNALVNNAAIFAAQPLGTIDAGHFDHFLTVNARGPLLLTQALAPMLGEHHQPGHPATLGRVVNFVDAHVLGQPMPRHAAYNASKAALLEITRTLAVELAPQITVNAIAPGVVAWADSFSQQERQAYLDRVPLARPGTPEDAAAAVLFLLDQAHYCTGQVIRVDGGRLLT